MVGSRRVVVMRERRGSVGALRGFLRLGMVLAVLLAFAAINPRVRQPQQEVADEKTHNQTPPRAPSGRVGGKHRRTHVPRLVPEAAMASKRGNLWCAPPTGIFGGTEAAPLTTAVTLPR